MFLSPRSPNDDCLHGLLTSLHGPPAAPNPGRLPGAVFRLEPRLYASRARLLNMNRVLDLNYITFRTSTGHLYVFLMLVGPILTGS
jgi:hypothetical protein